MQVDLYNGRKMAVVVFVFFSVPVLFFFSYLYDLLFSVNFFCPMFLISFLHLLLSIAFTLSGCQ